MTTKTADEIAAEYDVEAAIKRVKARIHAAEAAYNAETGRRTLAELRAKLGKKTDE